ncbi:MAG TPA: toluene-4-monooxygenase system B family protein [Polyangiaceae bacterium]|nr:toluene-4-monooxygenase system B family protein [Polyangiaceae bacterium]
MTRDELVPLYGFVQGDTLGLLVLVRTTDTVAQLAAVLQEAASMRVVPSSEFFVRHRHARLAPTVTIAAAGLTALDRVELVREASV